MNLASLKILSSQNLVKGRPTIYKRGELCSSCITSKQARKSFPSSAKFRASRPLELIYGDLCGPFAPETLGGSKYFLLLVDDCTRMLWVSLLKQKLEAFEAFKSFKAQAEREKELKLICLRTDNDGIQVNQLEGEITLTQSSYSQKIFSDFKLLEYNSSQTPLEVKPMLSQDDSKNSVDSTTFRSLMGSLRYLTHTRPDLMFCTGYLSRYMKIPSKEHFTSAKRVLRYVKGTLNLGLSYKQGKELSLVGYYDSDYGGDSVDRKSSSGAFFFLSDNIITWMSQKQRIVALSSCEAEYISLTLGACQGVWLADLITELTGRCVKPVRIFVDSKLAIDLAKNLVFHSHPSISKFVITMYERAYRVET